MSTVALKDTGAAGEPEARDRGAAGGGRARPRRGGFYLVMALIMAAAVFGGFSQTIGDGLIHPKVAPPTILYLHAALFTTWMLLFVTQTALVRAGNVALHRRLGLLGLVVGSVMPFVGVATAIAMRRFDILHFGAKLPFAAIPLFDMVMFTPCFGLAMLWRRQRPEHHRRLMFLATCSLIGAGLGRFPVPDAWFLAGWFDYGIDALIVAAMVRDRVAVGRISPVFVFGLPFFILVQATAYLLWRHPPAAWLAVLHAIVGVG